MIYGIAILIYLPLNIYNGTFLNGIHFWDLLRMLVMDGTMYHLWYLPASILGSLIAWFSVRRLNFKKAFVITFILFMIGVGGDSWYGLISQVPSLKGF